MVVVSTKKKIWGVTITRIRCNAKYEPDPFGVVPSFTRHHLQYKSQSITATNTEKQFLEISRMTTSKMIMSRTLQRLAISKMTANGGNSVRTATALRTYATNEKFSAKVCDTTFGAPIAETWIAVNFSIYPNFCLNCVFFSFHNFRECS